MKWAADKDVAVDRWNDKFLEEDIARCQDYRFCQTLYHNARAARPWHAQHPCRTARPTVMQVKCLA